MHITPDLSRESEHARSLARARERARVYRAAPLRSDSLARAAYDPATTTPRRATRSTDTGQNGARHCPATPTPERARSFERVVIGAGRAGRAVARCRRHTATREVQRGHGEQRRRRRRTNRFLSAETTPPSYSSRVDTDRGYENRSLAAT